MSLTSMAGPFDFGLGLLDRFYFDPQIRAQIEARRGQALGDIGDFITNANSDRPGLEQPGDRANAQQDYFSSLTGVSGINPDQYMMYMARQSPSGLFDPTQSNDMMSSLRSDMAGQQHGAYQFFNDQMTQGLGGNLANLNRGLAGLEDVTQRGISGLDSHRQQLGEGLDVLGLRDPNQAYQQSLGVGRENAANASSQRMSQGIADSFARASSSGVDPFESGGIGGVQSGANNGRFNDLFAAQNAANAERQQVSQFNTGATNTFVGNQMSSNSALDQAIAELIKGQQAGDTGLYNQQSSADEALRAALGQNYTGQLANINSAFIPQEVALQGNINTSTLTGQANEATRIANIQKALQDALAGFNTTYNANQTTGINNWWQSHAADFGAMNAQVGALGPFDTYIPQSLQNSFNSAFPRTKDAGGGGGMFG